MRRELAARFAQSLLLIGPGQSELLRHVGQDRVTIAGVELRGAQFGAFFYNVLSEDGESYWLYSLSGAPRENFAMPRTTAVFEPDASWNSRGLVG